jgi:hypothetical protein
LKLIRPFLEERDGGVYADLEAIALSRDIPAAARLFVTPIVRRVSKESLATSLHQAKIALNASMLAARKKGPFNNPPVPLKAERSAVSTHLTC